MAQRYKFSIESKNFPLDISGEPSCIAYQNRTDNVRAHADMSIAPQRDLYNHVVGSKSGAINAYKVSAGVI